MENGFRPELKLLTTQDKEKIFDAALEVLENVGMQLQQEQEICIRMDASAHWPLHEGQLVTRLLWWNIQA